MATLKEFNLSIQKMALAHKAIDRSIELELKYAIFTWVADKKIFEHVEVPGPSPVSIGDWNGIMLIQTSQESAGSKSPKWSNTDEALLKTLTSATELKPAAHVFIRADSGVVREVSACELKLMINITVGETSTPKPLASTIEDLAKLLTGASDEEIKKLAACHPSLVWSTFYRIGNVWYTGKTLEEKYPLFKRGIYTWVFFDVSKQLGALSYRRCLVNDDFLLKPEIKGEAFTRFAERMTNKCDGTLTMFADYDFVKNEGLIDVVTPAAPVRVRVKVDDAGNIVTVGPVSEADKPHIIKAGITVPASDFVPVTVRAVPVVGGKSYTLKPLKGRAGHFVVHPEGGNRLPHKLVCVSVADKDILVGYWVECLNKLWTPCPSTIGYAKELGLTLLADYPSCREATSLSTMEEVD